ncbi:MAG TPA: sigma-70 family RNA polymerase sigma factor [Pirellulaceae bacterium]|nr:sigma-70 family RNA polymerase sigma factor [Pirellulaceae bacterium]
MGLAVSESSAQNVVRYELIDPDVRLMLQVRDGSAAAFEELVDKYHQRVVQFMEHAVNRESAEDLAQEVFLRVYSARARYQPGAKFCTWFFTVANNVASNALRRLGTRKEVTMTKLAGVSSGETPETTAAAASGLMPTRQFDKKELSEVVRTAMQSLNERQRMAIWLSKFEEMSYQEIADTMELSVKAVKSLLSRARATLRDLLQPYLAKGTMPDRGDSQTHASDLGGD